MEPRSGLRVLVRMSRHLGLSSIEDPLPSVSGLYCYVTRCPQLSDLKKPTTIYLLTIIQFEQGLVEMAHLRSVVGRVGWGNSTGAE